MQTAKVYGAILNAIDFTKTTKCKIDRPFNQYEIDSIIGRLDVVWVTGDSLTAVRKFINIIKVVDLLELVTRPMLERMELDAKRGQTG